MTEPTMPTSQPLTIVNESQMDLYASGRSDAKRTGVLLPGKINARLTFFPPSVIHIVAAESRDGIEPRGCPTPGACSCSAIAEPTTQPPSVGGVERVKLALLSANVNAPGLHDPEALARAALAAVQPREPIPMVLHCPRCHEQHVDTATADWSNPPHRSHLCHACACIWRPADVATCGVAAVETNGSADNWDAAVQPREADGWRVTAEDVQAADLQAALSSPGFATAIFVDALNARLAARATPPAPAWQPDAATMEMCAKVADEELAERRADFATKLLDNFVRGQINSTLRIAARIRALAPTSSS